jgi:hypothetical protein
MKEVEHTHAMPPVSPAATWKGRLAAFLLAVCVSVVAGLCLYFFVSLRRTRLETGVFPPMRDGRPAGNFFGADTKKIKTMQKEPVYVVTFTNVSQQTLFRCYPIISVRTTDSTGTSESYDAVDIKSGDRHGWSVSGPDDAKGEEWPIGIHALCTYYDAFGFKHLIDKDVEKENVEENHFPE